MGVKEINQLIAKLEDEFNATERATPRKYDSDWKLHLVVEKYYYVNCRLRDIITTEEGLREAYYQVYLKLFSIYLKRLVKKNYSGLLYEIKYLCWVIEFKNDFFVENCCSRKGVLWVVKYNNPTNYLTKEHGYCGYDITRTPSDYSEDILKEAVQVVYSMIGGQFDKQVYKDKAVLEQPTEEGWHKLVMYCLDYFQEGKLKDELYLECMLS